MIRFLHDLMLLRHDDHTDHSGKEKKARHLKR